MHQAFSVHTAPEEFKDTTITGHKKKKKKKKMDLCLKTTRTGKSRDYHDVIVFEKLRFQTVFRSQENAKPAFSNSSGLMNVFEKLRFRDGLV